MTARPPFLKMRRKYEVDESYWLVTKSRSMSHQALFTLRRGALFFRWGRVPKIWEMSFIDRMRELEGVGLTFDEVLRSTLPELFGEDTSVVLRTWIGRKARHNPESFARSISKMFGASARNVLGSVDSLVDVGSLLKKKAPKETPIQSLLDAIQKADAAMTAAQPVWPAKTSSAAREESIQPVRVTQTEGKSVRHTA